MKNLSEVLLERNVSIITNNACQSRWDQGAIKETIYDSNVCVDEVDGTSACQVIERFSVHSIRILPQVVLISDNHQLFFNLSVLVVCV